MHDTLPSLIKDNNFFSIQVKKDVGIETGKHWKKYKNLGSTFIMKTFTRPMSERGKDFQFIKDCLSLWTRAAMSILNKSEHFRVTFIPRNVN